MLSLSLTTEASVCLSCGGELIPGASEARLCETCTGGLVGRRILAFFVDLWLWFILVIVVAAVGLGGLPFLLAFPLNWAVRFAFLSKDGLSGYSPGKRLLGLRVVRITDGCPADYLDSIRRNLPFLIPFAGLIMAFQLRQGSRWGDGWANTRVVRNSRYQSRAE